MTRPIWDRLSEACGEVLDGEISAERASRQLHNLARSHATDQVLRQRRQQRRRRWTMFAVAGATACTALAMLVLRASRNGGTEQLICQTSSGQVVAQDTSLSAPATQPLVLSFSEGSRVQLLPRTRLRAQRISRGSVELLLESGRLRAEVRNSAQRRWTYRAGPYDVRVVGTMLEVAWLPETRGLEVVVTHGKVRVFSAGLARQGIAVAAGEKLERQGNGQATITPLDYSSADQGAADAESRDASADDGQAATATPPPIKRPHAAVRRPMRWRTFAEAAHHRAAMRAARRVGFGRLLRKLGARDLLLLADAARLAGTQNEAQRVLGTLRERFPASKEGRLATFRLGRLAWDRGDMTVAVRWLRCYLRESPGGVLAANARGRLMGALGRLGDLAAARRTAREYLRRHPDGAYADLAHKILAEQRAP